MPPKKSTSAATKKSAGAAPAHASYQDMIKEAVINLKDRSGSSRQALKKYVLANNKLDNVPEAQFNSLFNRALSKGSDSGVFARPKGASGPVKLAKPADAAAAKPAAKSAPKEKKTTAAKEKKAPAKKAAATKATTKKAAAPKKTATKTRTTAAKANTGKARKTKAPTAAPAVEEKAPVAITKTKTGRVVKSSAPQEAKKAVGRPKKAAAAKKAAPKKSTTPKKA